MDLELARNEILRAVALCEQQLQSALVPENQKFGLQLARAQLFGSYAMVTIAMSIPTIDDEPTLVEPH